MGVQGKLAGTPPHTRPYWHVDAKWICGLGAMSALMAGLLLSVFGSLTSPTRGVELSATVVAGLFSKNGLDEPIDTTDLQKRLAADPDGVIAPIEGFPTATITQADLALPPRELKLKIFRQITGPIYEQGVEGAAKQFSTDPEAQQRFEQQASVLGLITKQTHDTFVAWSRAALGLAALLMAGVVFFSYRWGRMANPGALLVLVAWPAALLSSVILSTKSADQHNLGPLPADMVPEIAKVVQQVYGPVVLIGLGLLVVAGIGRLVTVRKK